MSKEPEEPKTYPIYLKAMILRPDSRQYRMNSIEYDTHEISVVVDVPVDPKYLTTKKDGEMVLTPAGVFYLQQQLEIPYNAAKETEKETEDNDWDEDEKETKSEEKKSTKKNDDWDEEPVTETTDNSKNSSKDVPWDEKDEDWK